jgi:hypothetical protein
MLRCVRDIYISYGGRCFSRWEGCFVCSYNAYLITGQPVPYDIFLFFADERVVNNTVLYTIVIGFTTLAR